MVALKHSDVTAMGRVWLLAPIVASATIWLYLLTRFAPEVDSTTRLRFPSSLDELRELAALLHLYYRTSPGYVITLFSSAYLYKQAFIIPGSALLNVLGGAVLGVGVAFPLVCLLTGLGASCCYLLSRHLCRDLLLRHFPTRVRFLRDEVKRNRHRLVYYLLFLRLFPMSPSWLINLLCPVVEVPFPLFLVTITVGLMPYNLVCVQAGDMLATLTSLDEVFTPAMLAKMALLAAAALGPGLLGRRALAEQQT